MNDATAATSRAPSDAHEEFEIARQAMMDAYAKFSEAKKHLKKAAVAAGVELKENATQQLDDSLTKARDKKDALSESASSYVKENPLTTVGLAFLGGLVFSRLFGK